MVCIISHEDAFLRAFVKLVLLLLIVYVIVDVAAEHTQLLHARSLAGVHLCWCESVDRLRRSAVVQVHRHAYGFRPQSHIRSSVLHECARDVEDRTVCAFHDGVVL